MHDFWRNCMDMMMGSGGVLMMLVMVLFWAAVLFLLIAGARWLWRRDVTDRSSVPPNDALRILERRFAAGEIDGDEFEARRQMLSHEPSHASPSGSPSR